MSVFTSTIVSTDLTTPGSVPSTISIISTSQSTSFVVNGQGHTVNTATYPVVKSTFSVTYLPPVFTSLETLTVSSAPSASSSTTINTPSRVSTTTSSTSRTGTSASATPSHSAKSSSDAGVIAGAAVGCFIGGLLVAALLTWCIMSSRQKKKRTGHRGLDGPEVGSARDSHQRQRPSEKPVAVFGVAKTGTWEQHLDQAESDPSITRTVKTLFEQIELHVENYYRDAQVNLTPETEQELMKVDSPHLPDAIIGLMPQTRMPTLLIKHCIANSIIDHITPGSGAADSFLPADYTALPSTLSNTRTTASKPGKLPSPPTTANLTGQAFAQALSRWRVLSAYLRPLARDDHAYLTARDAAISSTATALCVTFQPWAASADANAVRLGHLVNIMKSASDAGMLLFAQPASFRYRWKPTGDRDRDVKAGWVVVLPGFLKVAGEDGKELGRQQEMIRPVVASLF